MNRRDAIKCGVGLVVGLAGGALRAAEQRAGKKPNILILMCDQLNASVLSCYGGPVATPNISRLAQRGVVFTEATCPTPFCSPSRASLITGQYPHRHGIVYNVNRIDYPATAALVPVPATEQGITASDLTTEKLLHAAGYTTHQYGKWHLSDGGGLPYYSDPYGEHHEYAREMAAIFRQVRRRPRDQWVDWYGWALPVEVAPRYQQVASVAAAKWKSQRRDAFSLQMAEWISKVGRLKFPLAQVFDYRVAERTINRLRRTGGKPFMITCSFNYPHDPNVVPSPYYEAFDPDQIKLPATVGNREARFENDWSRRIVADQDEAGLRELLRLYYGAICLIDDQVGRVLDALEKTGRAEDTIVVFTADHGDMAGGHGMFWKSTSAFYDEIVRVPLIISYPRWIKPGRNHLAVSLVDLMPTLLELVGHPIPAGVQGRSLAPYLLGERDAAFAPAYTFCQRVEANPGHTRRLAPGARRSFMIRGKGWKYIRYVDGGEFLYHLAEDPGETRNLATEPSYTDLKSELGRELDAWLEHTGYPRA